MTSQGARTLYGVHGWLAWWIFISTFISPIIGFGEYASIYNSWKISVGYVPLGIHAIGISVVLLTIWQLVVALNLKYRLVPASRLMAITFCFLSPFLLWVGIEMTLSAYGIVDRFEYYEDLIKKGIGSFLWGIYFIRSKRCKNTYGEI